MVMEPSFWRHKKIFITGHTGFKGSWLTLLLNELNAEVFGFSLNPSTSPSLFELADIKTNISQRIHDIRDLNALVNSVKEFKPDIIFHLAAQPLVRYSYLHPVETYQTNVLGTVNILEAMRHSDSAKILINITSDKCYQNNEWHWGYRENDKLGGFDPYSNSKACAELVSACYRNAYFDQHSGKSIATVRAGNVIGGGDWACDRLIPDIVRAIQNHTKPNIRYPHAKRPWQHVLEPLHGYLLLAEKMWDDHSYGDSWNFGPSEDSYKTVGELTESFCQQWGYPQFFEKDEASHLHEATFLKLDISKALNQLKWQPSLSFAENLDYVVDWYQRCFDGSNIQDLTIEQIKNYWSKNV